MNDSTQRFPRYVTDVGGYATAQARTRHAHGYVRAVCSCRIPAPTRYRHGRGSTLLRTDLVIRGFADHLNATITGLKLFFDVLDRSELMAKMKPVSYLEPCPSC